MIAEGTRRFIVVMMGSFFTTIGGEFRSGERDGGGGGGEGLIFDLRKRFDLRWPDFDSTFSEDLLFKLGLVFDR